MKNHFTLRHLGFTLIEFLICLAVLGILGAIVGGALINTPGQTEANAYAAANAFIETNALDVKRKTCAHDSDGDGQASCAVVLKDGEKIFLSCPVGIINRALGAQSCKEVSETMMFRGQVRR